MRSLKMTKFVLIAALTAEWLCVGAGAVFVYSRDWMTTTTQNVETLAQPSSEATTGQRVDCEKLRQQRPIGPIAVNRSGPAAGSPTAG